MAKKPKSESKTAEPEILEDVASVDGVAEDGVTDQESDGEPDQVIPDAEVIEDENGAETGDVAGNEDAETQEDEPEDSSAEANVDEPSAELEPAVPEPVAAQEVKKSGGMSTLLGGALAAVLGFGVAQVVPNGWPITADTEVTDRLAAQNTTQSERIDDLSGRIDGVEAGLTDPATLTDLAARIDSLSEETASQFAGLEGRVLALEDRPLVDLSTFDPSAEVTAELAALRDEIARVQAEAEAQIEAARAEASTLEKQALEEAERAAARAAAARLMAALESGTPFSGALEEVTALTGSAPDVLSQAADAGIATMVALQTDFPIAARAALAAARQGGGEAEEGIGGFLRAQFGVRSLEPQDGASADAVLSRAEAAVKDGRLTDALAEIETLPDAAKSALSGWAESATLRMDALAAADALTQPISTN